MNICVWLTRHPIEQAQREYMASRGFFVKTLSDYANDDESKFKFTSGAQAWELAQLVAGRTLTENDVVVGVLPPAFLSDYIRASDGTPLLRAVMNVKERAESGATYEWAGRFERTIKVEIVTEEWGYDHWREALKDGKTLHYYAKSPQYGCSVDHYVFFNDGYVSDKIFGCVWQMVDSFGNSTWREFDSPRTFGDAIRAMREFSEDWKISEE